MTNQFELAKLKWKVVETTVLFMIIVGAMAFNAQNFDETEISALVMIALGWSGVAAVKQKVNKSDN